jgi:capsid protein
MAKDDNLLPAQRLNVIDKLVTFFNPSAGERRMVSRTRLNLFGYNDTPERRGKPPVIQQTAGETYIKGRDRIKAMSDARDLAMYDWIGGAIAKVVLYVLGRVQCKSATGDPEIDQIYDEAFHGFCGDVPSEDETTRCDVTGRYRLVKMLQHAFMGFFIDGDHGIVEIDAEFSPTGRYCLQNIEADRIGSPIEAMQLEDYIGGVKIDKATGRIEYYRVFRRTRVGQYIDPVEYTPQQFIHLIDTDKNDEYRGRTKLMRLLNDDRDIREIIEAEKIAIKTQSQWAALFGTKDPFKNTGPDAWTGKKADGTPTQDAQWGKILRMAEGENFQMLTPSSRPSGAFLAFFQLIVRKMAVSLGISYGLLWDLATLGGVTARIELQSDLRRIQYWQKLIEDTILHRVRRKFLAEAIMLGELPAHPNWLKCSWSFGPWISTDVGYETQADMGLAQSGLLPIDDIVGKYGYHPSEVFERNAATANAAIAKGAAAVVPVEVFARGLYPDLTDQKAAMLSGPPPPPVPGSIEAVGDKGVAKIIEIITSVKDGKLDRESAINALMTTFGMPRAQADSITPDDPTKAELGIGKPAPSAGGEKGSNGVKNFSVPAPRRIIKLRQ